MRHIALACASAIAVLGSAAPSAAAPARPDLRIAGVTAASAQVGMPLALTDVVRNSGKRRAGRSSVGFFLSTDARRSRGDTRLATLRVAALGPRKRARGRIRPKAPATPGRWFVIACADVAAKVRESNERNNCRATAPLTITAAAPVPAPLAPTPLPSTNPTPPAPDPAPPTPSPTPDPDPDPEPDPDACTGSGLVGGSGDFSGNSKAGCGPPVWGGCQVFPDDNAWNQDIRSLPVDALSDEYVRHVNYTASPSPPNPHTSPWTLRADWGDANFPEYGIPFQVVPLAQPLLPLTYGTDGFDFSDESDPGPYPFPGDILIEGQTGTTDPPTGDRHAIALRQGDCQLFETYNTVRTKAGPDVTGFEVSASATWDATINDTRPAGWTSGDAAGLPIFPGLAKHPEVAAGAVNHALRFTGTSAQRAYIPPGNHFGPNSNPCLPPYGARFRLKESFDISGYTGQARVILEGLKKFGMIFADQGSAGYISGMSAAGWDFDDDLEQLQTVPGTAFEVVQTGTIVRGYTPTLPPNCPT